MKCPGCNGPVQGYLNWAGSLDDDEYWVRFRCLDLKKRCDFSSGLIRHRWECEEVTA